MNIYIARQTGITEETSYMNWYAVRLLYKMTIVGKSIPELMDDYFSNKDTFFEESIILVTADSFDAAYQIAKDEAKKSNDVYENKYGQTVTKGFYDSIDCFELSDPPQMLTEVYSTIFCNDKYSDIQPVIAERYKSCSIEQMHVLRHK
jgi:hypothetical protein